MLKPENLILIMGVLAGFAITIYTFGLSLLPQLQGLLTNNTDIEQETKDRYFKSILKGFVELKEDVWIISLSFVLSILIVLTAAIFGEQIKDFTIPCYSPRIIFNLWVFLKLSVLVITIRAFIDLIRSLLALSEIILTLLKDNSEIN